MNTLYNVDGSQTEVSPNDGKRYTLTELQGFVAGLIEVVWLNDELVMVVNEEGKVDGLPVNIEATEVWKRYYGCTDIIVGNALVCSGDEIA